MHLFLKLPHCALSISRPRLFRRPSPPQSMAEEGLSFPQEVKAIDPKLLTAAMGGRAVPPEEPLLSTFEEGFGYITSAAVRRSLNEYQIVRKVHFFKLPSVNPFLIIKLAGLGCQLLRVARAGAFLYAAQMPKVSASSIY
ncbi:uncharacterized protein LACBIDRAFT_333731 [Laccaria bicolor S238N-H82]|uniref:Predicted protein n=1 Tax=Laccaria bicolor (strain S238N-H82 / ATCC MYA-4686) TaxID=486041 RepID=B0DWW2_LACBS|nr:uncharacterized protein LACBIDRAFT_333731 [Laccaria bicolor S238N-H82]EDR00830.1 predicted protein [Laccaria bicolor S238N-H82]|eukprot:XP_001888424.1 predicted protein [Laccaria bicolor S238N-H82]